MEYNWPITNHTFEGGSQCFQIDLPTFSGVRSLEYVLLCRKFVFNELRRHVERLKFYIQLVIDEQTKVIYVYRSTDMTLTGMISKANFDTKMLMNYTYINENKSMEKSLIGSFIKYNNRLWNNYLQWQYSSCLDFLTASILILTKNADRAPYWRARIELITKPCHKTYFCLLVKCLTFWRVVYYTQSSFQIVLSIQISVYWSL